MRIALTCAGGSNKKSVSSVAGNPEWGVSSFHVARFVVDKSGILRGAVVVCVICRHDKACGTNQPVLLNPPMIDPRP